MSLSFLGKRSRTPSASQTLVMPGKEMIVGKGNGKTNVSGETTVALSAHSEGYTLNQMTPDMIHVGALPQLVLTKRTSLSSLSIRTMNNPE